MTKEEFALWQTRTESSRFKWTEDEIFRLNGRGVFYYIGGEDGQFIKAHNDGRLQVGTYEGAIPHIGEAFFTVAATKQCKDFNDAFETALKVGGKKFLVDMFSSESIEDYRRSKIEKGTEKPDKSIEKPVTGMMKVRQSKKDEIYMKSFDEAVSSGEIKQYHVSRNKNAECVRAIDKAIGDSYKGDYIYELENAVKSVIADFGGERVKFVTAWHLQKLHYDGRYSQENKDWANAANIPQTTHSPSIYMNSHATLVDGFASHLRKITESPTVGSYKIKKSVLFTNNRGIAYAESKNAVSPFVTWQFKVENGERDYYWGHYFSNKNSATDDFKRRFEEYKTDNRVEEVKEKPDKSADKPLTGMAKIRQTEKDKRSNPVATDQKDKSKRKKTEVDL